MKMRPRRGDYALLLARNGKSTSRFLAQGLSECEVRCRVKRWNYILKLENPQSSVKDPFCGRAYSFKRNIVVVRF